MIPHPHSAPVATGKVSVERTPRNNAFFSVTHIQTAAVFVGGRVVDKRAGLNQIGAAVKIRAAAAVRSSGTESRII